MNPIKHSALLVCLCLAAAPAQPQTRHEIGIAAGGGLSALNYSLSPDNLPYAHLLYGFGGEASLTYTVFFNSQWGIGTGAGFALYNSTAVLSGRPIMDGLPQSAGDGSFRVRSTLHFYEERQQLWTPNVPLFLQYEALGRHRFYARLGGKLILPAWLPARYSVDATLTNEQIEGNTSRPLTSPSIKARGGEFSLKMGVTLSAEAGTKWRLPRHRSLYTGVYVDYGAFVDMHTPDSESLITEKINSVIQSKNGAGEGVGAPLVKGVSPLAVGVVVRLSFGVAPLPSAKRAPDIVDTLVLYDTVYKPIHDTVTIVKTETLYRELAEAGRATERGGLLVRRDTVMVYKEHHHYRTDTVTRVILRTDTLRVVRYRQTYVISNYLASAVYVSGEKKATLDHVISLLLSNPKLSVIVEGHTCNYGTSNINMALGLRRAQTVSKYLMQNGIDAARIKVVSKGDTEPIVLNDGEYSRRKNRRVKLIVVDREGRGE